MINQIAIDLVARFHVAYSKLDTQDKDSVWALLQALIKAEVEAREKWDAFWDQLFLDPADGKRSQLKPSFRSKPKTKNQIKS